MIFNMRRRGHFATQLSNIERTSDLFQLSAFAKLFLYSQNIHRLLIYGKIGDSGINQLMPVFIKRFGTKNFTHQRISVLLNHQSPQYCFFQLRCLRLNTSIIIYRLHFSRLRIAGVSSLFGHENIYYFTIYYLLFYDRTDSFITFITEFLRSGRQR